ncbi:hypothetical protein BDN72DRAFT_960144 [Pluteus cervinus]|uniref:Uncharacterized protein n=1 Tax=Pluteus cervinus TaxID=181527 RepID=A0ACD3ATJ5_9AGAR|nr:hypothetical protein BDN72DRAFT_960144 [Pluteus cervinus]
MQTEIMLEEQAKIDEEIRTLRDRIHHLLHSRNVLAHINQLPPEILVKVFGYYQKALVDRIGSPEEVVQWIRITHICQKWRFIAFDSKALWTIIPTPRSAYAKFASQLSHPLPISIMGTDWGKRNRLTEERRSLFLSLLPRIEKMEVGGFPQLFFVERLTQAPSELPLIEEINFRYLDRSLDKSPFPKSLKRLTLSFSRFEWDWLKLDHLTELHLVSNTFSITVASFVNHMLQIPTLSSLEIRYLFRVAEDVEDAATESSNRLESQSTQLPSLKELIIEDSPSHITEFMSCIRLDRHFTLQVELAFETPDQGVNLFSRLHHHLQASQHTIQNMVLHREGDLWTNTSTTTLSCTCFDRTSTTSPFLRIQAFITYEIREHWLDWIQTLPLQNLHQLSTNVHTYVPDWQGSRFRNLDNLHELFLLDRVSSYAFLKYLAEDADLAKQSDDWHSVSFPLLKEITLVGCEEVKEGEVAALAGRAEHGHKLEALVFKDSNVEGDAIAQLTMVVEKVTVVKPNQYL